MSEQANLPAKAEDRPAESRLTLDAPTPGRRVSGLKRAGLLAIVVFVAGFGGWSYFAPLASAALANGVISPEGSRRPVQHYEGGIIAAIHVEEGDQVAAGDPLMTLEDVRARADDAVLRAEYMALRVIEARLLVEQQDLASSPGASGTPFTGASGSSLFGRDEAERISEAARGAIEDPGGTRAFREVFNEILSQRGSAREEITLPDEVKSIELPEIESVIQLQRGLLASHRGSRLGREAILRQRIAQLEEEVAGLQAQISATHTELALIQEEIESVKVLLEQGLERRPRLLALQRAQAELKGELAASHAGIARARQQMGETEVQIVTLLEEYRDEIGAELSDTRLRLNSLAAEMRATEDALQRTIVAAPVAGAIINMHFKTPGGVISSGEPLLEIVPKDVELLIDARVRPTDIDNIRVGLRARVILPAYRQRNLPRLYGVVRYVAADAVVDEHTGERYFLARVAVDEKEIAEVAPEVLLTPGMPAEVMILTGERTLFEYIVDPLLQSFRRSFRDA